MAKLTIQLTEVTARTFGHSGRTTGTVIQLGGHPHLDGQQIARIGESYAEICGTCAGSGFRPEYGGIDAGRCWPCAGSGLGKMVGRGTAIEVARKIRNRAQAADRRAAKREAKWSEESRLHAEWLAANPQTAAIAERFGRLTECGHGGGCAREACWENRQQVADRHAPLLLDLAGRALYGALTADQALLLAQLSADHEVRAAAREAKEAKIAERKWLGVEKEKVSVTGTLGRPYHSESEWGTSTLYKLTTAEGDVVAWFRTGYHEFEAGTQVTLTGTVKKLAESEKYGKETVLTRCKIG
jgi:hypothetical protein